MEEQNVNVNAKSKSGATPLHKACEYGNQKLARYLLSHGADANETDDGGNTPFQLTCKKSTWFRYGAINGGRIRC